MGTASLGPMELLHENARETVGDLYPPSRLFQGIAHARQSWAKEPSRIVESHEPYQCENAQGRVEASQ